MNAVAIQQQQAALALQSFVLTAQQTAVGARSASLDAQATAHAHAEMLARIAADGLPNATTADLLDMLKTALQGTVNALENVVKARNEQAETCDLMATVSTRMVEAHNRAVTAETIIMNAVAQHAAETAQQPAQVADVAMPPPVSRTAPAPVSAGPMLVIDNETPAG